MYDEILRQIRDSIDRAHSFLITGTSRPDGDSIGAQLALLRLIAKRRPQATILVVDDEPCPERYRFLVGSDRIRQPESVPETESFDVAIVVDGGPDRIGRTRPLFDRAPTRVVLDHHRTRRKDSAELPLNAPDASSSSEIVYWLLDAPGWRDLLDAPIAEAIYTGIIFDTGSFQYELTSARTHRIAAELLETGIDFPAIALRVLLTQRFEARLLAGLVLEDLQRTEDHHVAWGVITREMMRRVGATEEDDEGIVNQIAFCEGVDVAILFKERQDAEWKLSLRSKGKIDVGRLALQLDPGGGGHPRAAGCSLQGPLDEVVRRAVQAAETALHHA